MKRRISILFLLILPLVLGAASSCSVARKLDTDKKDQDREIQFFNLTNESAAAYLSEVDYSSDCGAAGYNVSSVEKYKAVKKKTDRPNTVTISWTPQENRTAKLVRLSLDPNYSQSKDYAVKEGRSNCELPNLIPGQYYYYKVIDEKGKTIDEWNFITVGQVRMIALGDVYNVRDLGGWKSSCFMHKDGTPRSIRYGLIYRGSELNDQKTRNSRISTEDKWMLLYYLGIQSEVDFRTKEETGISGQGPQTPWLGNAVNYIWSESQSYNGLWGDGGKNGDSYELTKKAARAIYEEARKGNVIYFHCHGGRDRTGIQAFLIEGLCGVSENDLNKDYELTHLAADAKTVRTGNLQKAMRNFWNNVTLDLQGDTLQERFNDWFLKAGFTQEEIDWYIDYLLN